MSKDKIDNGNFIHSHFSDSVSLHASCVSVKGTAVLLIGEASTGKSDLALRMIDRGAELVSDDQVVLSSDGEKLTASSPDNIKGLIEIRGIGIFRLPYQVAEVGLVVKLSERAMIERLPYPESFESMGIKVPQILVSSFDATAPIKIEMSIAALHNSSMMVGALTNE
ncbi:MAG: HPr kinase/phosphatase C-terminal domain-containing protein [Pseudomonadota bacterium]